MGTSSVLNPSASASAVAAAPAADATAVVHCYDVLEICRACGVIDFTDGKYVDERNDHIGYLAAQERQANYLLDQVACDRWSRVLDVGCGYGRIVAAANRRGARATGITISPPQVAANRAGGLDVQLCNYRNLFRDDAREHWEGAFTGIIAMGRSSTSCRLRRPPTVWPTSATPSSSRSAASCSATAAGSRRRPFTGVIRGRCIRCR
jgi:hypothetical protein